MQDNFFKNSNHQIQEPYWPGKKKKKKAFKPTHNLTLLNIENNDPFLPLLLVLSNSHKPTKPYYTFNY